MLGICRVQAQHLITDTRIDHKRLFKLVRHFDAGFGVGIEQAHQLEQPKSNQYQ